MIKLLLKCKVDVNSKNFVGLTALDILQHESKLDNRGVRSMLYAAGAMGGVSLPTDCTYTRYLRLDYTTYKIFYQLFG